MGLLPGRFGHVHRRDLRRGESAGKVPDMTAGGTGATIVTIAGIILALLGLLADVVGIGREPGFGWKQTLALLVGLALIGAGWLLGRRGRRSTKN